MFNVSGKMVELKDASLLMSRFALFIIEFDYDNRLYIGHTVFSPVKTGIRRFINSVLDESNRRNVLLKESMQNSGSLYVSIVEPRERSFDCLFKTKYDLIIANGCYEPFGFNKVNLNGNRYEEEKKYVEAALGIIGDTYKSVVPAHNARSIKEYKRMGREYVEIAKWPSITAAARFYNLSASNIAACCGGRLHSSYGRLWRYSD